MPPDKVMPLLAAIDWLQMLLLGSAATLVAIIAVAAAGMGLLCGRINVWRGREIMLGCALIFGASRVSSGLMGSQGRLRTEATPEKSAIVSPFAASLPAEPDSYDPFVGASAVYRSVSKDELRKLIAGGPMNEIDRAKVEGVYTTARRRIERLFPDAAGIARVSVALDGNGRPTKFQFSSRMLNPVVTLTLNDQLVAADLHFAQKSGTIELPAFLIGSPEAIVQ